MMTLFDNWTDGYEQMLATSAHEFPFDGYEEILDEVVRLTAVKPGQRLLDLGTGVGKLAARFAGCDCDVWAVDSAAGMLAQARTRPANARVRFVQADLLAQWPGELDQAFDRIVSAYVLHKFDPARKLRLIQRLAWRHLEPDGRIVIADIAFATAAARAKAQKKWTDLWDEDEHYWAADEAVAALGQANLKASYRQVSSCGGIFVVEGMVDSG
jgi:putative AdoMet-dependent methyltransferase